MCDKTMQRKNNCIERVAVDSISCFIPKQNVALQTCKEVVFITGVTGTATKQNKMRCNSFSLLDV